MKTFRNFLWVAFFGIIAGCSAEQQSKHNEIQGTLYANEYGEIRLIQLNDTQMRTVFKNNDGYVFDTIMFINYNFKLIVKQDSLPFLQLGMSGIEIRNECLYVHDFSNIAYMQQYAQIEKIYTRAFYKIGEEVTVTGDIRFAKGTTIDGIWLKDGKKTPGRYVSVHGIIKKEKYPIEYYSTDESPQGMFGDTSIVHYRLIMEDYTIEEIPKRTFKGTAINIDNQAAFIYEFADSEAYYLDAREPWTQDELGKEIEIEAVLVQFIRGKSVLKNWELVTLN